MIANRRRPDISQKSDGLAGRVRLQREEGHVATRARSGPGCCRPGPQPEHDRDDRCRLPCCEDGASRRDDDIHLEPDELVRDLGIAFGTSLRPAILDRHGAALDPVERAQPLHKSGVHWPWVAGWPAQDSMVDSSRRLRARRKGHAAAAAPASTMNSRLLTRSPRRRGRAAKSAR
jgi:hypothetical protein